MLIQQDEEFTKSNSTGFENLFKTHSLAINRHHHPIVLMRKSRAKITFHTLCKDGRVMYMANRQGELSSTNHLDSDAVERSVRARLDYLTKPSDISHLTKFWNYNFGFCDIFV